MNTYGTCLLFKENHAMIVTHCEGKSFIMDWTLSGIRKRPFQKLPANTFFCNVSDLASPEEVLSRFQNVPAVENCSQFASYLIYGFIFCESSTYLASLFFPQMKAPKSWLRRVILKSISLSIFKLPYYKIINKLNLYQSRILISK